MFIKQVSAFIENKPGRLCRITKALGEKGIDIIAMSIADTTNFGIMRCIVNQPEKAMQAIRDAGFTASITEVLAVEVPDVPGGLARILDELHKAGISIEYLYSFVRRKADCALILFRVEDNEKTLRLFEEIGVNTLSEEQVYEL